MKAEELRADYVDKKLLSSRAYLYYLIRALRKDGWKLHIPNISLFCEQWGFKERSFYRAKAILIERGLLQEKIYGSIDLWVNDTVVSETDTSVSDSATSGSSSATSVSDSATSGSKSPSEVPTNKDFSSSSPYYTSYTPINSPLSQSEEREMKKSLEENGEGNQEGSTFTPLATLLPKTESIQKEADSDSLDSCSVPSGASIKPEFLNWVIEKVKQFPKTPQFPRQAAIALIKRNQDEIEAEYEEWQATQERNKDKAPTAYDPYDPSASSPAPPALRELDNEEERRAYKLAALQGMWKIQSLRSRAEQQCKEWEFEVTEEGPRDYSF